jgi:NADPH:quinone reductase
VLPQGTTARQGASAFINPLTVLGMVDTMRREGHSALVHTAAAFNLGQMLNRVCQKDGIALVNIVRSPQQAAILRELGAKHVLDSTAATFTTDLIEAVVATGATLAFDAIGGGNMATTIYTAEISLREALSPAVIAAYSKRATGEKYLIVPSRSGA